MKRLGLIVLTAGTLAATPSFADKGGGGGHGGGDRGDNGGDRHGGDNGNRGDNGGGDRHGDNDRHDNDRRDDNDRDEARQDDNRRDRRDADRHDVHQVEHQQNAARAVPVTPAAPDNMNAPAQNNLAAPAPYYDGNRGPGNHNDRRRENNRRDRKDKGVGENRTYPDNKGN